MPQIEVKTKQGQILTNGVVKSTPELAGPAGIPRVKAVASLAKMW